MGMIAAMCECRMWLQAAYLGKNSGSFPVPAQAEEALS